MKHKNYSRKGLFYEAFIDIAFLQNGKEEYSEVITMWIGDFESIMDIIPLNDNGMYVALAAHYQVDTPWEENEDVPWKVDDIELSLEQLLGVRGILSEKKDDKCSVFLCNICEDICNMFQKARDGYGNVFIKYYY